MHKMKKKFTVAILGAGGRGYGYSSFMKENPDKFKIVAVCDINNEQLVKINKLLKLSKEDLFNSEEEFFKEKRADVLIIATWDKDHVRQSVRAMRMGYDLLLEKPVCDSEEELYELLKVKEETGKKVVVCHELRYGIGYRKIAELIKTGEVGRLIAIDAMERVAYWHMAQAYIRLESKNPGTTHPTILAKCSHDLDYIQHYAGSQCDTVSSIGGLGFFRYENMPKGASEVCLECAYVDTCPYSARKIYIDTWKKEGCPEFVWPYNKVSLINPNTEKNLYEGLKNSVFGQCVFRCGVEKYEHISDHQMVQMHFKNGVDATLKMLFAGEPGRRVNLFGTHGEIVFDEISQTIEIKRYGKEKEIIKLDTLIEGGHGHGGGDAVLIKEFYSILVGEIEEYTSLNESIECHLIGIAAEKSRLSGGEKVKVHSK